MISFDAPWRLRPDNFTPPTRTPWGGQRILGAYKTGLAISPDKASYPCVGESWEISVDLGFPSILADAGETLSAAIAMDVSNALGAAAVRGGLSVLVKLLDARQPLSVQVHPSDDYAGLQANQSGKPESWFILDAAAGAGLYLGFKPGVSAAEVRVALSAGASLEPMMNFVPVQPGDVFEIEAGTVHAIGAGVTLVEPQLVQPGKEGVTYRFWDWNRRYDDRGVESPSGQPRALHLEHSLAVSRFDLQGDAFVSLARKQGRALVAGDVRHERYIDNSGFAADWVRGSGAWRYQSATCRACLVTAGQVRYRTASAEGVFQRGESFFVPHAAAQVDWLFSDAAVVCVEPR